MQQLRAEQQALAEAAARRCRRPPPHCPLTVLYKSIANLEQSRLTFTTFSPPHRAAAEAAVAAEAARVSAEEEEARRRAEAEEEARAQAANALVEWERKRLVAVEQAAIAAAQRAQVGWREYS